MARDREREGEGHRDPGREEHPDQLHSQFTTLLFFGFEQMTVSFFFFCDVVFVLNFLLAFSFLIITVLEDFKDSYQFKRPSAGVNINTFVHSHVIFAINPF